MRLKSIHKVYQNAESELLGRMSQKDYDAYIKKEITQSISEAIFDRGKIPLVRRNSLKESLGMDNEDPFFQYECECILLSREEFEKIVEALRTIKNTL